MIGIDISKCPGIGDKIQFTSIPENYYRTFGEKLIDINNEWVFDYNPFVIRDKTPTRVINVWDIPRPFSPYHVWRSLAERNALYFEAKTFIRHPRFYRFEDNKKTEIVIHTTGKTCGPMPEYIIEALNIKYPEAIQVGSVNDISIGIKDFRGLDLWDTVEIISKAKLFIGVDSSPAMMATAYPECWTKKVLVHYNEDQLKTLVPMANWDGSSHWYDNTFSLYNRFDYDIGSTYSYTKL